MLPSHHVTKDWKLKTHVLQTGVLNERNMGANVAELLSNAVNEWKTANKDIVLVTDNTSNMVVAAELGHFVHLKGCAHTLNLQSTVRRIANVFDYTKLCSFIRKPTLVCIYCYI